MDSEAKQRLYDVLFAVGQQVIDHHQPCHWKDGMCRRMRSIKGDKGCCEGCRHLTNDGCAVQSLACKLWLCDSQARLFRECETELKILRQVADYCGIPYEIRRSKEENFNLEK